MKIIKNERYILRNARIGRWCTNAGMLLVLVPMFFYIQAMMQENFEGFNFTFFLASTVAGMIVSQIGIFLGNRFGRVPRVDEKLDAGLKGLPGDFTLYHYSTPASHVLIGPAGVLVLLPYYQRGQVTYRNHRWRMSGGGFLQGYMRVFGQESLGRPEAEAEGEISALRKHLMKRMDESEIPAIQAALVFTDDRVQIDAANSPLPALRLKQLKDYVRQRSKERLVDPLVLGKIKEVL
jgi:hypothetical protein